MFVPFTLFEQTTLAVLRPPLDRNNTMSGIVLRTDAAAMSANDPKDGVIGRRLVDS
jgi:hypothetical protein